MALRVEDPATQTSRAQEALRLIEERPGISVAELQVALEVSDSRLRKIVSALESGHVRREPPSLPEPRDLQPLVSQRPLPPEVQAARNVADAHDAHFESIVAPLIEGHLATYTIAVDAIEEAHQHIADSSDLDLVGDNRWAALWQLGGRSIGYCRVLLALARLGFGDEALPTARALHEADRLLGVFDEADERQIVLRWLGEADHQREQALGGCPCAPSAATWVIRAVARRLWTERRRARRAR